MEKITKLERIAKPQVFLRSIDSIIAELNALDNVCNENEKETNVIYDLRTYDLCLFSLIEKIDGHPDSEIGNKENKAIKNLAMYGIQERLLERSARIFAQSEKNYEDIRGAIKDRLLSKGEALNSEMLYVLELKKGFRSPIMRDEDKLYLRKCIDQFGKYWCKE